MKDFMCIILIWLFLIFASLAGAEETDIWKKIPVNANGVPTVTAKAAVLIDGETGQILYSHNPDLRLPNASTTKIMTALLAVENLDLDSMLTASKNVAETQFTSLYLTAGEQISVKDALAGAVIKSANDTCVLFAENIAGSQEKFAQMMNQRARELGCKNTHFVTPNGLNDKEHYSTAMDLCLIAREAIKYPIITELAQCKSWVLSTRTVNKENILVKNKQKYILNYPYATGLKPGYTKQAGNCLVGTAEKDGRILISCILGSTEVSAETAALMEYGFNKFDKKILVKKEDFKENIKISNSAEDNIPLKMSGNLFVLIPQNLRRVGKYETKTEISDDISAPVREGDILGKMAVYRNGKEIASIDLLAGKSARVLHMASSIKKNIYKFTTIILILAVIIYYAGKIAKNHGGKRHRVSTKVRRDYHGRQSHRRRYKSYIGTESRPRRKSYSNQWKRY